MHKDEVREFFRAVEQELERARTKFPGKPSQPTIVALMEEVGEVAKAAMDEPISSVKKELIQTCVMALRIWLDGDQTIEARRQENGLEPLSNETERYWARADKGEPCTSFAWERRNGA
jgi:NTP pyrophosphatase (non-canonical NTP hydrolase)